MCSIYIVGNVVARVKSNWIKWLIVLGPVVLLIIFVLMGMRSHREKMQSIEPAKPVLRK